MSIERFRRQRAVDIKTAGSYVLPNWYDPQGKLRTFACRTTRVSPFRMIVDVPVVGKIGDTLTSYFQDFGNLEGVIIPTVRRNVKSSYHLYPLLLKKKKRTAEYRPSAEAP